MIGKLKNKIKSDKNLLELMQGGAISFIFQIIGIILSYLFILLVSHFYGAKVMGIFALSFAVLNIFVLFGKFGLDVSSIKFIGELSEQRAFANIKDIYLKILVIAIPVNIFLTIVLFYLAPYVAEYIFHKSYLTIYLQFTALGILPMAFRFIHANAIRGMKNIKVYSFLQNITMYLFSLIFLLFYSIIGNNNSLNPIIAILIGLLVGFILSIYFWLKESNFFKNKRQFSLQIKEILSTSTPLLLSSSIMLILGLADTVMLGMFENDTDVGIYNVSYKIATAGMIIFMAISSISTPKIAASYGNNNIKKLKKIIFQTTKLIIICSLPIYLIIFTFTTQLLGIFGNEFIRGTLALIFLTIGFLVKTIFGTSEYILQMSNQQKSLVLFATIIAFLNIFLNYLLIPKFGIEGAAISSMISIIVYQTILTIKVRNFIIFLSNRGIEK